MQADEMFPKINTFKQYYVHKQELVYVMQWLQCSCDVVGQTAHISAIFPFY